MSEEKKVVKAYKGFNKDMTCRGFQYEEGKTYHTDDAKLCESGFHACLNPLDCLSYYDPAESVYHEVELEDVSGEKSKDSKICGKTIKIGAKLSLAKIAELSADFIKSKCKKIERIGRQWVSERIERQLFIERIRRVWVCECVCRHRM